MASDNALITRSVISRRGANPHDILQDQVVLVAFSNLLDGLVGLLDHRSVFFILTQIQIFSRNSR